MTLLTHMPGIWDYMLLISIIATGIGISISAIVTIILLFIHKKAWTPKKYTLIAVKLFFIFFFIMVIGSWVFLSMG